MDEDTNVERVAPSRRGLPGQSPVHECCVTWGPGSYRSVDDEVPARLGLPPATPPREGGS